jgi:hypothetical protein
MASIQIVGNQARSPGAGGRRASRMAACPLNTTWAGEAAGGKKFIFFGRNPLKSPDSAKLNQIKPSKSKPFCLV